MTQTETKSPEWVIRKMDGMERWWYRSKDRWTLDAAHASRYSKFHADKWVAAFKAVSKQGYGCGPAIDRTIHAVALPLPKDRWEASFPRKAEMQFEESL